MFAHVNALLEHGSPQHLRVGQVHVEKFKILRRLRGHTSDGMDVARFDDCMVDTVALLGT